MLKKKRQDHVLFWLLPLLLLPCLSSCTAGLWHGSNAKNASLSFSSFDGGGPEFTCTLEDPSLVSVSSSREYAKANHEELTGAGYTVTFVFTGKQPGQTTLRVTADSPIAPEPATYYLVTVGEDLTVTLTKLEASETSDGVAPAGCVLALETQNYTYAGVFTESDEAQECIRQINASPAHLTFSACVGGYRAALPWNPVSQPQPMSALPGDLLITEDHMLLLCTEETELTGTLLAQLGESSISVLADLTESDFEALLCLEWNE